MKKGGYVTHLQVADIEIVANFHHLARTYKYLN